ASERKIPNPKSQIPKKSQNPNLKRPAGLRRWRIRESKAAQESRTPRPVGRATTLRSSRERLGVRPSSAAFARSTTPQAGTRTFQSAAMSDVQWCGRFCALGISKAAADWKVRVPASRLSHLLDSNLISAAQNELSKSEFCISLL